MNMYLNTANWGTLVIQNQRCKYANLQCLFHRLSAWEILGRKEVKYHFLPFIDLGLVPQISALIIILVFPLPLINSEFGLHKLKIRTI